MKKGFVPTHPRAMANPAIPIALEPAEAFFSYSQC